jgi:hypothetical protein
MLNSGLFLSSADFNGLSPSTQHEILNSIGLSRATSSSLAAPPPGVALQVSNEEGLCELTLPVVRKLADKLGEKTLSALRAIAKNETTQFYLQDIMKATGNSDDAQGMRAVWSALTRRTRKILDDDNAILIVWDRQTNNHDDNSDPDYLGKIAPLTQQSLKSYFGL